MNRRTPPTRSSATKLAAPVLFSLPDVSLPTPPTSNVTAHNSIGNNSNTNQIPVSLSQPCEPAQSRPMAPQSIHTLHTQTTTELPPTPKTNHVLNTAITVLLAATVLIALRIYTLPTQNSDSKTSLPAPNATYIPQPTAPPVNPIANNPTPNEPTGVVFASSTSPVPPPALPPVHSLPALPSAVSPSAPDKIATSNSFDLTNIEKPTLEIKDPSVSVASYEQAPSIPSPLPRIAANAQGLPQTTPASQAPPSTLPLPPNRTKPTTDAQSLNTRDMILLRQGKQLASSPTPEKPSLAAPSERKEFTNQPNSSTSLNGSTYPPVKQKYEPISIPNLSPITSRPTSMEIPPPPTPYQPIGANFEDNP